MMHSTAQHSTAQRTAQRTAQHSAQHSSTHTHIHTHTHTEREGREERKGEEGEKGGGERERRISTGEVTLPALGKHTSSLAKALSTSVHVTCAVWPSHDIHVRRAITLGMVYAPTASSLQGVLGQYI